MNEYLHAAVDPLVWTGPAYRNLIITEPLAMCIILASSSIDVWKKMVNGISKNVHSFMTEL